MIAGRGACTLAEPPFPAKASLLGRGIPVIIHDALNRLIASETGKYLTFVLGTAIAVRAASG